MTLTSATSNNLALAAASATVSDQPQGYPDGDRWAGANRTSKGNNGVDPEPIQRLDNLSPNCIASQESQVEART